MEVLIFLLMSSIRSMPFPLGIHLLQGLVNPPDLLLGHNHTPQDDPPPEPPVPDNGPSDLPESDLDIPDDPILNL